MALGRYLLTSLCLAPLLFFVVSAAPFSELADMNEDLSDTRDLVKRVGETRFNPVHATFDITGWPGIAEENCYAMLCMHGGDRT